VKIAESYCNLFCSRKVLRFFYQAVCYPKSLDSR